MAGPQGKFYELLGNRLREARRAANITQAELASSVGISRTSLTNMERGRQPIYVHVLAKIGESLGMELTAFFSSSETSTTHVATNKLRSLSKGSRSWVERVISKTTDSKGDSK